MVSIQHALTRVKQDLPRLIESLVITYLAEHHEHVWRCRQLDPLTPVLLFATQVLQGNTAITHLRHLAQMTCSATAYCKARKRLLRGLIGRVIWCGCLRMCVRSALGWDGRPARHGIITSQPLFWAAPNRRPGSPSHLTHTFSDRFVSGSNNISHQPLPGFEKRVVCHVPPGIWQRV